MKKRTANKVQSFFENQWIHDNRSWAHLGSTEWQAVYERQIAMLDVRSYPRALEIGCGAGHFSAMLARRTDRLVALDIAPTAIAHARARIGNPDLVDFRVANIMEYDVRAEGPWDLVVMNDTIYAIGSVYTFFEVAWLAAEIYAATSNGGWFLMANTSSEVEDDDEEMRPWIIRTYRDLFQNVGYELEAEESFPTSYRGIDFGILISLFAKR